jgi:hypothetical protein
MVSKALSNIIVSHSTLNIYTAYTCICSVVITLWQGIAYTGHLQGIYMYMQCSYRILNTYISAKCPHYLK